MMMHRSRSVLLRVSGITRRSLSSNASETIAGVSKVGGADTSSGTPETPTYTPLYHHENPTLFPPLVPGSLPYLMHNLASAGRGIISLISSQEARDGFLALTEPNINDDGDNDGDSSKFNGAVINTNVIGQSDIGFVKVLALYDDLILPLYNESGDEKFHAQEFMDGVGFALEQFHRTKEELFCADAFGVDSSEADNKSDGDDAPPKEDSADYLINNALQMPSHDILSIAKNNPDSKEHLLVEMTTPEGWEMLRLFSSMRLLAKSGKVIFTGEDSEFLTSKNGGKDGFTLVEDSTKVSHVALLSARIQEITAPDKAIAERINDPDAPLEDDALKPHIDKREDAATQVVTQLEVLYDLEQSYINGEDKTLKQSSVMVGKFEACLRGDPNGNELRWRLCSYRPALEFGYGHLW
eukprot:g2864.t1 g2864   contig12:942653-944010(-)